MSDKELEQLRKIQHQTGEKIRKLLAANSIFAVLMAAIGDYGIMALNLCAVAVLMMNE